MADFLGNLFGGQKPAASVASSAGDGFADFASPVPPSPASSASPLLSAQSADSTARPSSPVPYTKWYRVWERSQLSDFYAEMFIIPILLVMVLVHLWGVNANRRRARAWAKSHAPLISQEYAVVGFNNKSGEGITPEEFFKENSASEFVSYATGRANVAFLDTKITLARRYNPFFMWVEQAIGFFIESMPATQETVECTAYTFDGKEKDLVPGGKAGGNSSYDGFVFAIVNKDSMKQLREDRYDISLTTTKEHPKLPGWASVMSENAEITETLLTPELVKAVEDVGDDLIALIVTDQPNDKPKTLAETLPRKRVSLHLRLSSYYPANTLSLVTYFLRLPDILVSSAHFRPETLKRVKATRQEEINKLQKVKDAEEAEERKEKADKEKKEERDRKLKSMSASEQQKFLEKEREKDLRKSQKKRTMKG